MSETALDKVFAYYGNTAESQDYFDAAKELLAERRKHVATQASALRVRRRRMLDMMRETNIPISAPFIQSLWMHSRHEFARMIPRATIPAMERELDGLAWAREARRSPEYQRRMESLPCGLQDAEDERRHEDEVTARLLPIMIWLVEMGE